MRSSAHSRGGALIGWVVQDLVCGHRRRLLTELDSSMMHQACARYTRHDALMMTITQIAAAIIDSARYHQATRDDYTLGDTLWRRRVRNSAWLKAKALFVAGESIISSGNRAVGRRHTNETNKTSSSASVARTRRYLFFWRRHDARDAQAAAVILAW